MLMRSRWFMSAAMASALASAPFAHATTEGERTVTVLFIGNSLTYYNAMPDTFARLARVARPGLRVDAHYVASDGAMLEDHWKLDWTRSRLAERHWDYVVLQDQGGLSRWIADGKSHAAPPLALEASVDRFAQAARNAGSTVVLYETAPARADAMPYVAWAYTTAANRNQAILAPAGRVLFGVDESARKVLLPQESGGHPSPQGSCVIAATIASAIFRVAAQPLVDACADGDAVVRGTGSVIDRQLEAIGTQGAYRSPGAPQFDPPPAVIPGQSVDTRDVAGDWYAREAGLPMSFGVHLALGAGEGSLAATMNNYGVNTLQAMRVDGVGRSNRLLRIESHGDGRTYVYTLARHHDALSGFLAAYVNGGTTYTPVSFVKRARPDDYFAKLDDLQVAFEHTRKDSDLDTALLQRYKALEVWLGEAEVKRVAWADPASDAWYALLTGQNYADLGNNALALAYYSFAVRHFPKSYDAYGARGQLLESMGMYGAALPDLTRAASLLEADHRSDGETEYAWRRDRVRKAFEERQAKTPSATPTQ